MVKKKKKKMPRSGENLLYLRLTTLCVKNKTKIACLLGQKDMNLVVMFIPYGSIEVSTTASVRINNEFTNTIYELITLQL